MSSHERSMSLGSETMLGWQLLSATHLEIWALMYMSLRKGFVTVVCLLELRVSVCMMRICFCLLSLLGKCGEDVTAAADTNLPFYSCVDSILPKSVECIVTEVCSWGLVRFVLIMPNTSCLCLALFCRTGKEVGNVAIVNLNSHIGFEEWICWGPPSFLGSCWELNEWDSQDRMWRHRQSSFSRLTGSSPSDPTSITSGNLMVWMLDWSPAGSSVSLMTGDETTDRACLACLRGGTIALAWFLTCLMPCLMPWSIVFAWYLASLDREADEVVEWGDEHDDIAEDFVEWQGMGMSHQPTTVGTYQHEPLNKALAHGGWQDVTTRHPWGTICKNHWKPLTPLLWTTLDNLLCVGTVTVMCKSQYM